MQVLVDILIGFAFYVAVLVLVSIPMAMMVTNLQGGRLFTAMFGGGALTVLVVVVSLVTLINVK